MNPPETIDEILQRTRIIKTIAGIALPPGATKAGFCSVFFLAAINAVMVIIIVKTLNTAPKFTIIFVSCGKQAIMAARKHVTPAANAGTPFLLFLAKKREGQT